MTTIFASPEGGTVEFNGENVKSYKFGIAVHSATPGDVVQLVPGVYTKPVVITDGGLPNAPITIRGFRGVVLDGHQPPNVANDLFEPNDEDFSFIKLISTEHVIIEGLSFQNCWPCSIYIRGCQNIKFKDSQVRGSRFVVYARSKRPGRLFGGVKTKNILLEKIDWNQDPEALMWSGNVSWKDVKGKTDRNFSFLNGALFGSWNIRGHVTIRYCKISHAFNGIRMDCEANKPLEPERCCNINVIIHDNEFRYIRDNAIEAEKVAVNWWVYRNKIFNAHAPFSFHGLAGGWWYIFGNQVWFDSKPGKTDEQRESGQGHRQGQLFKLLNDGTKPFPSKPWYIFNNSFYIRGVYAKEGETRLLNHFNNAIQFCLEGSYCDSDRKFFGEAKERFRWNKTYVFENDMSNHRNYPNDFPAKYGYKLSGIPTSTIFSAPHKGDLTLVEESEGHGTAVKITIEMADGTNEPIEAKDIGALQEGHDFICPEYVEYDGISEL